MKIAQKSRKSQETEKFPGIQAGSKPNSHGIPRIHTEITHNRRGIRSEFARNSSKSHGNRMEITQNSDFTNPHAICMEITWYSRGIPRISHENRTKI